MHYKRRSRRKGKGKLLSCGCCESYRPDKEPIEDGACTGKSKKKKARPPKEKCPVNRTHEWYKEVVTTTRDYGKFYSFDSYTEVKRVDTCIHCWKERRKMLSWRYN